MSFLALPFLFATLAAAIPVVLHMISRQKAKELPFSTLRFLRISVEKTRRRKRIQDLLLMLVRMAVLVLIAVGLARPTLTSLRSLWGGSDSAVAIILDNSMSMGVVDQGRVRFRTALRAAEQIMDQLNEKDQVALLLTGGPELPEEGKLDRTHAKVLQVLRQWVDAPVETSGVSYERADLAAKVTEACRLLADSDAADKHVYVLTDLQKLSWEGGGGRDEGPGARGEGRENGTSLSRSRERAGVMAESARGEPTAQQTSSHPNPLPQAGEGTDSHPSPVAQAGEGTETAIILVDCNRAPKPNVSVVGVEVRMAIPVAGQPAVAKVVLFNAASVPQQRHVELYVDGVKTATSPALSIPPGERLTHEIPLVFDRSGLRRGEVVLAGEDGCRLDDRRVFAADVDRGIPVAVVKPQRHEIPYLDDTFYLERALSPGTSGNWAIRTTALTAADLSSQSLVDYKVVFCVNLPAPDAQTAQRLRAHVTGGGNLVWVAGENVQPASYNEMNQQAGGQLLPLPLVDIRTPEPGSDRDSWSIGYLDKEDPALRDLVEPNSLYRSVLVYKHVRMDAASLGDARVLARLDDENGETLLVERNVDRGKVLLLGTSVHTGWSNLAMRPIFLPLVVRLTLELAGAEPTQHQVLAGSPLVLPLSERTGSGTVEIRTPAGQIIRRPTVDPSGQPSADFRYADTHEIGIYELRLLGAARGAQVAYAVNSDPDEADPATIDSDSLRQRFAPMPLIFADNPDDLSGTFSLLRQGTGLGELFLSAVLMVLVFETFLSNRLSPKQS